MHFSESMTWLLSLLPLVGALIGWVYWHNTDLYRDYTRMSKQDREEMAETMAREFNAVAQELGNLGHSMSQINEVIHHHAGALNSIFSTSETVHNQGLQVGVDWNPDGSTTLAIPQFRRYIPNNGTWTYERVETIPSTEGLGTYDPNDKSIPKPAPSKPIEVQPEKLVRPLFHEYD